MKKLLENPLFLGVSEAELEKVLICFQANERYYREKEFITTYNGQNNQVGLLISGAISLKHIHADGTLDILEYIQPRGIFGAVFTFFDHKEEFVVVCEKDCRVLFIDKEHIIKRCPNACMHHSIIVENLFSIMSEKVLNLTEKVEILSHRSIREKLLCYFRIQSEKGKNTHFQLPFSFLTLSNYLCIDRSAMMREIKKMKEEDIIRVEGKEVFLL